MEANAVLSKHANALEEVLRVGEDIRIPTCRKTYRSSSSRGGEGNINAGALQRSGAKSTGSRSWRSRGNR